MSTARPPFAVWSETDHSGPIIIVTTLALFYWFLAGTAQQAVSYAVKGGLFNWADCLFTASMVAGLVQSVFVLIACSYGLGKSSTVLSPNAAEKALQLYHVSNILYIVALGLMKLSAACFVASLTVKNLGALRNAPMTSKMAFVLVAGIAAVWTLGSAIALAIDCKTRRTSGLYGDACASGWVGIYVGDAISDLVIAGFAGGVIGRTKSSLSKRVTWYFPFCIRMCVPIIGGIRLYTIDRDVLDTDPPIRLWKFIIFSQLEIFVSLIATASPTLKKSMMSLVTYYGAAMESRDRSRSGRSYALRYLSRSKMSQSGQRSVGRSFGNGMRSTRTRDEVAEDGDSQQGIIRQVDVEQTYERAESPNRGVILEADALRSG